MKKLLFIMLAVCTLGCKTRKEKIQPLADNARDYFMTNISDLQSPDTLHILVDVPAFDITATLDNTTFLYYSARILAIYHTHNAKLARADKWLYFDKHFNPISKYSFITKAASTDNEALSLDEYSPLSDEQLTNFKKPGGLIYY